MKFILGVIVGIVISTVGVNGTMRAVSKFLDNGIDKTKQMAVEAIESTK